jgi:hypothetical protein
MTIQTPSPAAQDRFYGIEMFGAIPNPWAETLAAKGWGRVRVEGTAYLDVILQCQQHALWPLWVIKSKAEADAVPGGIDVEILNEPDLAGYTPAAYAAFVMSVYPILSMKSCCVYAGCVSNQSKSNHQWLKAALAGLPADVRASGHRYPGTDQDPTFPKEGYSTRAAEMAGWTDAIGGRRFAITEIGFNTAPYYTGWWLWKRTHQRTDAEVLKFLKYESAIWKAAGAEFVVVYQLNDGPGSGWLDRYGIRTTSGTWKPSADLPMVSG